jgi:hypothetical protein
MANGGFAFLLLPFQCLVGWGLINLAISVNSFRLVQFENCHGAVPLYGILVAINRHGT